MFRKIPSRKNGKKYKRFSSAAIKTSGSGPSTAAVFPGGRLIPEDSKDLFAYRMRGKALGYTEEEFAKVNGFFGLDLKLLMMRPHDISSEKRAIMDKIEQLVTIWSGTFRGVNVHHWNYVKLPIAERTPWLHDWLRLYFEGNQYMFVEKDRDVYRRSLIYSSREKAYRDYGYKNIIWVEREHVPLPTSSVAASTPVP